jgi:hypothetical protein
MLEWFISEKIGPIIMPEDLLNIMKAESNNIRVLGFCKIF